MIEKTSHKGLFRKDTSSRSAYTTEAKPFKSTRTSFFIKDSHNLRYLSPPSAPLLHSHKEHEPPSVNNGWELRRNREGEENRRGREE
jgi:hypothetical protein